MKIVRLSKMNKLFYTAVVLSFFSAALYGQQNPTNNYVPPSPNAAALGKFADMPANIHTGLPQVSVPVYSWNDKNSGLNLNISLNYHAGGVKVEEIASNIGLGWALNAGGVVTRTMRGLPDENPAGFLNTPVLPNIATAAYDGQFIYPDVFSNNMQYNPSYVIEKNNTTQFSTILSLAKNDVDAQQDIFYYNFNGRSGRFYIGKDGSILLQTKDNLKISAITYNNNKLYSFEIIDESGIQYVFDAREMTTTTSRIEEGDPLAPSYSYISSWYLSAIKSADRLQQINFTYLDYNQDYNNGFSESLSMQYNSIGAPSPTTNIRSHSSTFNDVQGKRIQKIEFPDLTSVDFTYAQTIRLDLNGDRALEQITVANAGKSFGVVLQHDYFNNSAIGNPYMKKRLRLDKVTEFGGLEQKPPYQFFYNGYMLPDRNSVYLDHWGYPISSLRNIDTRISKIAPNTDNSTLSAFLDGADKSPDSVYAVAGSLQSIQYPTGGTTTFEMESNEGFESYFSTIEKSKYAFFNQTGANQYYNFDLNEASGSQASLKCTITETGRGPWDPNFPIDYPEEAIDQAPVSLVLYNANQLWSTSIYNGTYGNLKSLLTPINFTFPQSGTYKLKFVFDDLDRVRFNVTTEIIYTVSPQAKIAGGIRIKKMTIQSGNGPQMVKEYEYKLANGQSSGKLATVPNYTYYRTNTLTFADCNWTSSYEFIGRINRGSESTQPLGAVQGSPIGYSTVTVREMDNGIANGKKVYEFTPLEYFDSYDTYPYRNGEYISWGAGLPLKEETYNASGQLLHSLENTYIIQRDKLTADQHRSLKFGLIFDDNCKTIDRQRYVATANYPIVGITQKTQQKERSYTGSNFIETLTTYKYDNQYNQLIETKLTTSSDEIITKVFYPYHYGNIPVYQQMVNQNRIGKEVKRESWKSKGGVDFLIGGSATLYDWKDAYIRPAADYILLTSAPLSGAATNFNASEVLTPLGSYEALSSFEKYNDKGAPVYMLHKLWVKSAFVWCTNGIYLKASARNANQTEIYVEDFEQNGNVATAQSGAKGFNGSFTPAFTVPNSREYMLSYWSYNGSNWIYSGELPYTGQTLMGLIDGVRIYPKDAEITSYTYDSLGGVTSVTDPKGLTNYYEYDNFNRLMLIKDHNGNIVKTYDYHYKP